MQSCGVLEMMLLVVAASTANECDADLDRYGSDADLDRYGSDADLDRYGSDVDLDRYGSDADSESGTDTERVH
jgi:hypothetical protein